MIYDYPTKSPKSSWLWWSSAIGIFILSALSVIWAVATHGVNVPYYDQWDRSWEFIILNFENQTLILPQLFQQHNEHRIFFTNLLSILSAILTDWNIRFEIFMNAVLCIANGIILMAIFRKHTPRLMPLAVIIASLLVISLNQYGNLLFGFQSPFYFVILFLFMTFYCLDTPNMTNKRLGLATFFAICATFSLANGVFVWFIGLFGMWLAGVRSKKHYVLWLLATIIFNVLFFSNYYLSSGSSSIQPVAMIRYIPIYLSSSLMPRDLFVYSLWYPLAIIVIVGWRISRNYYYLFKHGHHQEVAVWWMIALTALIATFLSSLRRPSLQVALDSRYITLSILFWIGVLGLILTANSFIRQKTSISPSVRRLYWGNIAFIAIFFAIHLLTTMTLIPKMSSQADIMRDYETCVLAYPTTQDESCLEGVYLRLEDNTRLINWILQMQERGMGPFSGE